MLRGRPPLPVEPRRPKSGDAPPETDPARVEAVAARLLDMRIRVADVGRNRGLASPAKGEPCSWKQLAVAAGRKVPGDLPGWASGARRVREETLLTLERQVERWITGETTMEDTP